ncbi:MAG: diguanylate cyclase [Abditibacteriaceae bacterium]
MSQIQPFSLSLKQRYSSFFNESTITAMLLVVALIGVIIIALGVSHQKYFIGSLGVLFPLAASALIYSIALKQTIDWPQINRGWILMGIAVIFAVTHEFLNLTMGGVVPLTSPILIALTIVAQSLFAVSLILIAWPPGKNMAMRAFLDSLVIILAILVLAWMEGVHPFVVRSITKPSEFAFLLDVLIWLNTVSGILLIMSAFFFFIASQSKFELDYSILWIFWGTVFFFAIHLFRTYSVFNLLWGHMSVPWFIVNGTLTLLFVACISIGVLRYGFSVSGKQVGQPPPEIGSRQRMVSLWLPYGVALAVALILMVRELKSGNPTGSGLLPIVLMMTAIISRQVLIMWDNLKLSEQLTKSNLNLEQNVTERTNHLATLHSITSTLNSTLDRKTVLKIALEQIMYATNADQGALWLRTQKTSSQESAEWQLAYAKGFLNQEYEDALRNLAIDTVEDGVDVSSNSESDFKQVFGFSSRSGKLLIVPIRCGGLLLGAQALVLNSGKYSYDTRSVVESVALEVGTALQNARLYQEARHRADRDGVTGLYNHRAIQDQLSALLRDSRQKGEPFAVLMMDLNDFKYFNDTYGHPVGDDVLRAVATQLEKINGDQNPVGRYGGDEFIILMPGQNHSQTIQTYQKLLAAMEEEHFEVAPGVRIPINMSYGWSIFPDDGQSALDLITIADANLYRYKQRGEHEDETSAVKRRADSADKSTAFGVLDALITAIDNKDHYTRKHSDEVAHYALLIAEELGYSTESMRAVRISGLLHDVGKIAVPDDILRHPGKLSHADWEIMKGHPSFGALIVKDLPHLEEVITGIRFHHERWDGRGYPEGLTGANIPIMGRLLAVPDTYSALTTNRPYRKGHTPHEALLEIKRSILTQFDPLIAKTFLELMKRELKIDDLDEESSIQNTVSHS